MVVLHMDPVMTVQLPPVTAQLPIHCQLLDAFVSKPYHAQSTQITACSEEIHVVLFPNTWKWDMNAKKQVGL